MSDIEPTPEELSAVTNIIARFCASLTTSEDAARAVLAAGYRKPEWEPGRWYRAVAPDGSLWLETSNPKEVHERARPGDRLERLWHTTEQNEWRPLDPEAGS